MKGADRRKLYHHRGIFTAQPEAVEKKTARSWRVLRGLFAYAHEPAHTTTTPENQNRKQT